jgi:hypothetical protein
MIMLISFPVLCSVMMIFVHGTVEFAPRIIREHRVRYRPIQTHVADWVLIMRFALLRAELVVGNSHEKR